MQEPQETQVQSLGWEDALEQETAVHLSILVWRIPWIEQPGRLQSMGCRVRHDWTTFTSLHIWIHGRPLTPSPCLYWKEVHRYVFDRLAEIFTTTKGKTHTMSERESCIRARSAIFNQTREIYFTGPGSDPPALCTFEIKSSSISKLVALFIYYSAEYLVGFTFTHWLPLRSLMRLPRCKQTHKVSVICEPTWFVKLMFIYQGTLLCSEAVFNNSILNLRTDYAAWSNSIIWYLWVHGQCVTFLFAVF